MLVFLIALIVGLLIGLFSTVTIPTVYYPYITLVILSSLNSIIFAAYSRYTKTYSNAYFILKWISDLALVIIFNALGDAIAVDLATPVIIFLGISMFNNLSKIRRAWFRRQERRRSIMRIWVEQEGSSTKLPIEEINTESSRQAKAIRLRNRARDLRIEADSLISEADTLEEEEAIEQLQQSMRKEAGRSKGKVKDKNPDTLESSADNKELDEDKVSLEISKKAENTSKSVE